jgi:type IV secretory pathway TrbF-like protein
MQTALPPPKDMNVAKQMYLEQYGSALVMNTYLRIALVLVTLCCGGLVILNVKTYQTFRNFKPLVIRINEIGRAEALAYDATSYTPRDSELKYFLVQFTTKYYGRARATIRDDWTRALYYLDGHLAAGLMNAERKNKVIETFLSGKGEEIEINVTRVVIEDLRASPYKGTVDFEKVYFTPQDHVEIRRERFTANFVFVLQKNVSNTLIPYNPLGITITYFHEDQAFQ